MKLIGIYRRFPIAILNLQGEISQAAYHELNNHCKTFVVPQPIKFTLRATSGL